MRLLIDANLSPKLAAALRKVGLESVDVGAVEGYSRHTTRASSTMPPPTPW